MPKEKNNMKILKNSFLALVLLSLVLSALPACTTSDDDADLDEETYNESTASTDTLVEVPFDSEEADETSAPEHQTETEPSVSETEPEETPENQETAPTEPSETPTDTEDNTEPEESAPAEDTLPEESSDDATVPTAPSAISIKFSGSGYSVSAKGVVSVNGNVLTITKGGTYILSGTLNNAQLRVAVDKTEKITLILSGVSITNNVSAPLYIESADKVSIELEANTTNTFTDSKTYYFAEGEDKPNACIYSSEDITIKGDGALVVKAYYNNGIGSKNDLKIKSGSITVEAANNALKGNQSVTIEGGSITLKGSDGIKSDSTLEGEGVVDIVAGNVNITAGDDGIQAVSRVCIESDALVTVNAADKDINCEGIVEKGPGTLISK